VTQLGPRDVLAQYLDLTEMLGDGTSTPLADYLDRVARMDRMVAESGSVAPTLARNLRNARPYWITERMTPPIELRATGMHELTQVDDPDHVPPQRCGFAVFEDPIRYREMRGREQITHVVTWGPSADQHGALGTLVQTFNDLYREPDEIAALMADEYRRRIGRWHGISTYWLPRGMRIGPVTISPTEEDIRRITEDGDSAVITRNMGRTFLALWGMLSETLSVHTSEGAPRSLARRLARAQLSTEITVITLRRAASPAQHPGTGTPLDHRVWVDDFRRRQWVGAGVEKRQEWRTVRGHWRGPQDAPIVDRPKVDRLAR
jgi:hypothetical protein